MTTIDELMPTTSHDVVIRCKTVEERWRVLTFLEELWYNLTDLRETDDGNYLDPNFRDTFFLNPLIYADAHMIECCTDRYKSTDCEFITYREFMELIENDKAAGDIQEADFNAILMGVTFRG